MLLHLKTQPQRGEQSSRNPNRAEASRANSTEESQEDWYAFMLTYGEFILLANMWPDDDDSFVDYFVAKLRKNKEEKNMNEERKMPEGVLERLEGYAERAQKKIGEAVNEYLAWIGEESAVDHWQDEDDDLLVEWAEMFTLETRNLGSSGSSRETVTFVGQFVGIDDKINDYRENLRNSAISAYRNNSSQAIDNGLIGIVKKQRMGYGSVNGEPTKERIDGRQTTVVWTTSRWRSDMFDE